MYHSVQLQREQCVRQQERLRGQGKQGAASNKSADSSTKRRRPVVHWAPPGGIATAVELGREVDSCDATYGAPAHGTNISTATIQRSTVVLIVAGEVCRFGIRWWTWLTIVHGGELGGIRAGWSRALNKR